MITLTYVEFTGVMTVIFLSMAACIHLTRIEERASLKRNLQEIYEKSPVTIHKWLSGETDDLPDSLDE